MSITGKSSLSLRKKDVKEQKSIAVGFKKIQFAHKATLGDTGINLNSLVLPTEMSGFTNPSPSDLAAAQLFFYRKNLTLISSTKGVLIDYMSYNVAGSTQINFNGWTADDGEIFTGIIDHSARSGVQLVDAAPLVSTGELAIAATDFNVGQMFEINKYSSSQVGAVIVYRNGVQQFRNTGNSSTILDGNYYEVNNGSGTGQIIRFNTAPIGQADSILVVSNGLMAYNPDGSALQMIESLAGKIDSIVPTVATLAGVPESNFGGVSNVDLKSFGDLVLSILSTEVPIVKQLPDYTPTLVNFGTVSYNVAECYRRGCNLKVQGRIYLSAALAGDVRITLPAGLSIDSTNLGTDARMDLGIWSYRDQSDSDRVYSSAPPAIYNSGALRVRYASATEVFLGMNFYVVNTTQPITWASGDAIYYEFEVPIVGWVDTETIRQKLGV